MKTKCMEFFDRFAATIGFIVLGVVGIFLLTWILFFVGLLFLLMIIAQLFDDEGMTVKKNGKIIGRLRKFRFIKADS